VPCRGCDVMLMLIKHKQALGINGERMQIPSQFLN
jgi:hypothetical protein